MRFALIGERLGHSLSVPIHEALFRLLCTQDCYSLCAFPPEAFPDVVRRWMEDMDGFNITIPYKRAVIPLLDSLALSASSAGAVNTAVHDENGWTGYNTDVYGFISMLNANGIDVHGKPCWVLGTGGASAAVRTALSQMGAASVTLVSRTPRGEAAGYDELTRQASGVLINTTPAGMMGCEALCPLDSAQLDAVLPRLSAVVDLIYNPSRTPLTQAADRRGIPNCTGLYMLVAQAVEAERLWQKRDIPDAVIPAIMKEVALP